MGKEKELRQRKTHKSLQMLLTYDMRAAEQNMPPRDFVGALRRAQETTGRPGLIAEVKKASPSRGDLVPDGAFDPPAIAGAYEAGGAACVSVLCDEAYFKGSYEYMRDVRHAGIGCPLLCKEFIVDGYQICLARTMGADAVLLIAAVLETSDIRLMMAVARKYGMACLIEVHTEAELERVLTLGDGELPPETVMIGINTRNLETFEVDLANTERILAAPFAGGPASLGNELERRGILIVGESGIFLSADADRLKACGVGAILVGESLVKAGSDDTTIGIEAAVKRLLGPSS